MKYFKILFITTLLSYNPLFSQGTAFPFLLIETSAKAKGMAGSFTAIANDANSMFYNPAGISKIKLGSFDYNYYQFFPNNNELYIRSLASTFNIPQIGHFGIDIMYLYLGKNILTDEFGNELGTFESKEWVLSVGYSKKINPHTSVGGSIKYFKSELANVVVNDFGLDENYAIGLDLGILFDNLFPNLCITNELIDFKYKKFLRHRTLKGLSIGLALRNIGPNFEYRHNFKAPLPQQMRIGLAWNFIDTDVVGFIISSDARKLLVQRHQDGVPDEFYKAWFTSWKDFSFNQIRYSIGGELSIFYLLSLRMGRFIESKENSDYSYWSYGFSIGPETLRFNGYFVKSEKYIRDEEWRFGVSFSY